MILLNDVHTKAEQALKSWQKMLAWSNWNCSSCLTEAAFFGLPVQIIATELWFQCVLLAIALVHSTDRPLKHNQYFCKHLYGRFSDSVNESAYGKHVQSEKQLICLDFWRCNLMRIRCNRLTWKAVPKINLWLTSYFSDRISAITGQWLCASYSLSLICTIEDKVWCWKLPRWSLQQSKSSTHSKAHCKCRSEGPNC